MSYLKITDGNRTIPRSETMISTDPNRVSGEVKNIRKENSGIPNNQEQINFELPMTFIGCPNCENNNLMSCKCPNTNYFCGKCNWKHITHVHETHPYENNGSGNVHMNSLLAKAVRK